MDEIMKMESIRLFQGCAPGSENVDFTEETFCEDWEYGLKKEIVQNVTEPTITAFIPEKCNGVGVLVIPGGALKRLVFNLEGTDVAEWLCERGFAAFVLKCRLPVNLHENRENVMLIDAQRAIRIIKGSAKKWGIDSDKIGVMGFSAGGYMASLLSTCYDKELYKPVDDMDVISARPDFCVLGYPAICLEGEELSAKKRAALGQGDGTLPEYRRLIFTKYSTDKLVTSQTPPAFIFETDDDITTPVEHSLRYYMACRAAGVSAEFHVFRQGSHGFGLGEIKPFIGEWKDLMINWMKSLQLL